MRIQQGVWLLLLLSVVLALGCGGDDVLLAQDGVIATASSWKVIEKNNVFWTFSWKVSFENDTSDFRDVFVTVSFLDSDGFELDWGIEEFSIIPNGKAQVSSTTLIDSSLAANVTTMKVKEINSFVQ